MSCTSALFSFFAVAVVATALQKEGSIKNGLVRRAKSTATGSSLMRRPSTTYLLSFRSCSNDPDAPCNHNLFQELRSMGEDAKRLGLHNQLLHQGLPTELLNDRRWARHLAESRGHGFWFWKPALLNFHLKKRDILDGDMVVWADGDVHLSRQDQVGYEFPDENPITAESIERTKSQFGQILAGASPYDFFVKDCGYVEREFAKGDWYKEFNVSWDGPQYGLSRQSHAQFWIVRINHKTRKFLRLWEQMMSNYHLASDEASLSTNPPGFKDNRHDQTALSLLLKASMIEIPSVTKYSKGVAENLGNYSQTLHPKYGVAGLLAIQGSLDDMLPTDHKLLSRAASSPCIFIGRKICVKGSCHDLDALPTDAVPPGVASQ